MSNQFSRRPMPRPDDSPKDPSHITDHPFTPRGRAWYDLCAKCGIAESAHAETVLVRDEKGKVVSLGPE